MTGRHDKKIEEADSEIIFLKRQVRQLQVCLLAIAAVGTVATIGVSSSGTIRARRLIIADAKGRDRIILDAATQSRPGLHIRDTNGADRVFIGNEPDPVIDRKVYPRIAPAWGMLIYNRNGDERGGMSNLDNGHSIVSLDRANGEGVYMTVNEASGFAGLVGNYEGARIGDYAEAFRLGTLQKQVFAQATNRDGSAAGAIVGGGSGQLTATNVVEK